MPDQLIVKAPEYIAVLHDGKWSIIISATAALITLLAVAVALFQEKIRDYFKTALLDVKINLAPPDCHQIMLTNSQDGSSVCNSIYIRLKVSHLKGNSAENVEIMLSNFWKINDDNSKDVIREFLPMNLVWSHFQPRKTELRIPKKLFRHGDFGYFAPLGTRRKTILKLDTMVQPNPVAGGGLPNIIEPGIYEFEIMVSGDNVKPIVKKWRLEFDAIWSEDEQEMLSDHITIEES